MYDKMLKLLEDYPFARERKNKNKCIAELIFDEYAEYTRLGEYVVIADRFTVEDIGIEFSCYDRYWRMILSDHPELRGSDYKDGKRLSQEHALSLGYDPNYRKNQKALKEKLGKEALAVNETNNY